MPASVPLRTDYSAADLRKLAATSRNVAQSRRLLSLAAVLDGKSRDEAARIGAMDRQTLRDWAHRFNESGPDGLVNRKAPGAAARLNEAQLAELAELAEAGPDPASDGVIRWRCSDLQAVIWQRFGVKYHIRHVGNLLVKLGFSHISARPQHPGQDMQATEMFKKTSPARWRKR